MEMNLKISMVNLMAAVEVLTKAELKLWLWIVANQPEGKVKLNRTKIMEEMNVKHTTYYNAYHGLMDKGYLSGEYGDYVFTVEQSTNN